MSIQDSSSNPLPNGTQGQMLGFIEAPAPEEVLTQRIYDMLIEQIRIEDVKPSGALFVKRFLEGPQEVWAATQARIFSIKDLWDLSRIQDEHLQYLKNIVGWTSNLDDITDRLDYATLRKLIGASIPLWKQRGTEDALQNLIELTTGARTRIWNWFDFRWVLDETEMGVEHQGRDPWIIDLPGPPNYDEYRSNIRIVDDGSIDKELVVLIIKLMRALAERWEISYITFLDRFIIEGDDTQWIGPPTGAVVPVVTGGVAKLTDNVAENAVITLERAASWVDYVSYWRIRGESTGAGDDFGAIFYWIDADNYYQAGFETDTSNVYLKKVTGGVPSIIATQNYIPIGLAPLVPNTFYGLRVQITDEGGTNRIKVFIDADEVINTTDPDHAGGTAGFYKEAGVTNLELDEIELFQLPLDTELVDINP